LQWIALGKAKFPMLEFTEANFQMVLSWLSREMADRDVRLSWINHSISIIAVGVLVPSRRELIARNMFKRADNQRLLRDMSFARDSSYWRGVARFLVPRFLRQLICKDAILPSAV